MGGPMEEPLRISRGELTSSEVLRALEKGRRVIIAVELLGRTMELSIREGDGTYYCDTPVKLLTYETEEDMRTCLERYRLAEPDDGGDDAGDAVVSGSGG